MRGNRASSPAGGASIADRRFTQLLVQANPAPEGVLESPELVLALDRLGERITAGAPGRPRARRRLVVAVAFVAALLAVTAVALGAMLTTHTGIFPKVAGTENDKTELLRTDAPDFPPLVAKLVRDIAFPPGYSRSTYVTYYVDAPVMKSQNGVYNTVQAAGVQGTIARWAVCAWRGYWLQAHATGDVAAQSRGVDGLRKVASSDALARTDSFWPKYLALADDEQRGTSAAPSDLPNFDAASCAGLERAPGPSR